jgi:sulfate adenylyltransferase subunit 1
MVTGASTADSVIFLIDASQVINGSLLTQTKRHTAISCLLNIPNFILAVNKMDLVNFDKNIYQQIVLSFTKLLHTFDKGKHFTAVPISALHGDNIVKFSKKMPWYKNKTLISSLENNNGRRQSNTNLRLPIQLVMRWDGEKKTDQRAYSGKLDSGQISLNEEIKVWPSNQSAKITKLTYLGKEVERAFANQCVTIWLDKDIDVARGDIVVIPEDFPGLEKEFNANIAWLDSKNLNTSRKYILRQATRETQVKVEVINKLNLSSLNRENAETLSMNEIGLTFIKAAKPILIDSYKNFPKTGSFILIDDSTHQTCAAGMIC